MLTVPVFPRASVITGATLSPAVRLDIGILRCVLMVVGAVGSRLPKLADMAAIGDRICAVLPSRAVSQVRVMVVALVVVKMANLQPLGSWADESDGDEIVDVKSTLSQENLPSPQSWMKSNRKIFSGTVSPGRKNSAAVLVDEDAVESGHGSKVVHIDSSSVGHPPACVQQARGFDHFRRTA